MSDDNGQTDDKGRYVPPRPGDKLPPDELKELRQLEDRATKIAWLYPWDREDD